MPWRGDIRVGGNTRTVDQLEGPSVYERRAPLRRLDLSMLGGESKILTSSLSLSDFSRLQFVIILYYCGPRFSPAVAGCCGCGDELAIGGFSFWVGLVLGPIPFFRDVGL